MPGLCSDAKAISVLSFFFFFLRFFFCVENFESGCRAWALRVIGRILALLLVSKPILSVGRTVARDHAAHVGRSIPRGRAATHPAAHFQCLGRGHARVGHRRFPFPRPARARAGSLHTGPGGQPARSPLSPGPRLSLLLCRRLARIGARLTAPRPVPFLHVALARSLSSTLFRVIGSMEPSQPWAVSHRRGGASLFFFYQTKSDGAGTTLQMVHHDVRRPWTVSRRDSGPQHKYSHLLAPSLRSLQGTNAQAAAAKIDHQPSAVS